MVAWLVYHGSFRINHFSLSHLLHEKLGTDEMLAFFYFTACLWYKMTHLAQMRRYVHGLGSNKFGGIGHIACLFRKACAIMDNLTNVTCSCRWLCKCNNNGKRLKLFCSARMLTQRMLAHFRK